MRIQSARKYVQRAALGLVLLIPVLESYKRLLRYLPPHYAGALWRHFLDYSQYAPDYLKGGYLAPFIIILDGVLGNLGIAPQTFQALLNLFGGSYWSVTIGGLTFLDPLAFLQVLSTRHSLPLTLAFAGLTPIILAVILGRAFCSWLCPMNTVFEFTRPYLKKRLGSKLPKRTFFTFSQLRYLVFAFGLIMIFFGIAVFPYILPYVLLGRFLYYLTTGTIFWIVLVFLAALVLIDALQRGFWCRYLCPTGAFLTLVGWGRLLRVKHSPAACKENCRLCEAICSWGANPKTGTMLNCTNCGVCVHKCPRKALGFQLSVKQGAVRNKRPLG